MICNSTLEERKRRRRSGWLLYIFVTIYFETEATVVVARLVNPPVQ
jgi:hypothetical protein